ncbi:MAG: PAS domain S-box protein [Burkholderiaceae bacterium]
MSALLVAASLLPLAIWAYFDVQQERAHLLTGVKDILAARGDQIVHELDGFHRGHQRAVDRIARYPDSAGYCAETPEDRTAHHARMLGILAAFPASDAGIRGAALLDGSGHIVIATEAPLTGVDLSDRPVVRAALQGRAVTSDPFVSSPRSGSVPTIAYLAPMLGPDQKVACVAVLWVRAASLWNTVKASNALVGPDSFAVLFDREGIRIAHTFSDEIVFHPGGKLDPATLDRLVAERRFGERTRALLDDVRPFPEQFERARSASPDLSVFRGFEPVKQAWNYGVARRFETVPWTVFYMVPEAAVVAQIARTTQDRVLLSMGIIALAGFVGLAFTAGILRPVRSLSRAVTSISEGDLGARVQDPRGDELGRLGGSFNAMAERIQQQDMALRQSRDQLDAQVQLRTAELTQTTLDLQAEIVERARMESVLRERDTGLHRAHVMTKLAHVITRPDGSFETWSETLPPLAGVEPARMPKSTREWMGLLHPDDRSAFRNASIDAAVTEGRTDVEYRLQRSDGAWVHVRQVIEPIPGSADAEGKMRWFSTLQDVTEQTRANEELRESQQLLKAIIDNSATVIYVKDLQGRYLLVNRRFAELLHLDAQAIVGKSDHELFAKEAADAVRSMDQRVAAADAPLVEEEFVPHDGNSHTYVSVKCPLRDHQGRVIGVFGISTDITDRKHAEDALRASEERTRLIVDTALDAVVTMDAAGTITGWSPQAETTFGWTHAEALGRSLAQTIIPPRLREDHERGLERYLATGVAVVLNKRVELTALHRDGREFPIDLSITPIRAGGTPSFSAFVRDITDRKLAQAHLQAQLERLTLLDQITRAIGERQDLQSIYQVAIRSLEERLPVDFACVFRYDATAEALTVIRVGAHSQAVATELAMNEQSPIEIDQNGLSRCVRGELVYEEDVRAVPFPFPQRLARGGLRSLIAAPLQSESRVFGILVVARQSPQAFSSSDCEFLRQLSSHVALAAQQAELHGALQQAYDELRQTQQTVMQQERLRALGQMASGIAHDINNAISPVALYTESLLEREPHLSERGRGYLITIARAIDDVAATVARMREFYRQREPQLLPSPVRLNALVQQVLDLTRARWSDMPQQRGMVVRLETELAPDLPTVLGVEGEVREALINLIFNAVDAMPNGGVLTLRTRCADSQVGDADAPARRAILEVSDTGTGMDEDTRRRCLEPFFTTKGERGTGLGLAMVYGAAQRHGAAIDIDSIVGSGTTVRLSFPVPAVEPAALVVPAPQAPVSRLRILIVDDDPMMLKSLCDTLQLDGHVVVTANGGQAGIDTFLAARRPEEAFDVVITDLGMPYVDGRKVASAVKSSAPTTPVILLTGWGQRLMADGDIPEHMDRVLSKPPKLRDMRAALAQLVRPPNGR